MMDSVFMNTNCSQFNQGENKSVAKFGNSISPSWVNGFDFSKTQEQESRKIGKLAKKNGLSVTTESNFFIGGKENPRF